MPNHHFLILYTTLQGKKYILTLAYSYFLTKQETSKNVKSEAVSSSYTDKKENRIFPIYREIQSGAVPKSYMTNGLLIYREIFAHFPIY
jgi:hypothetical protein